MGNSNPKPGKLSKNSKRWPSTQTQFSISSNVSSFSVYSASRGWSRSSRRRWKENADDVAARDVSKTFSTYSASSSASRPWSRSSTRRRWKEGGAASPNAEESVADASKTFWPVAVVEAMFLPEFPIKVKVDEMSFQVVETIARGAFGKVVRVVKKDTKRSYAMKILSKAQVIVESAVQQCKDEVSIQVMCKDHPFVVGCQFYWQNRKRLFLVSEFIPNGELLILWKTHGRLPESVAKLYLAELAYTLDYLHNTGVVYRDLKMENILLDNDGHIQLIDFGLAKWLSQGNRTRTICGTIQYMAPEILRAESYTHAVDWWSLGVITYALMTGHFPVERVADHTLMSDLVAHFDYTLCADNFSYEAIQCLRRLLCKDPVKRLQSLYHLRWEPFMRTVDIDVIHEKKISPLRVLKEYHEAKKKSSSTQEEESEEEFSEDIDDFEDFQWIGNSMAAVY